MQKILSKDVAGLEKLLAESGLCCDFSVRGKPVVTLAIEGGDVGMLRSVIAGRGALLEARGTTIDGTGGTLLDKQLRDDNSGRREAPLVTAIR